MCLPTTYEAIHAGAILMPQTRAERRRLDTARATAQRLRDRPTHRRIHPEFEARHLEEQWGMARPTAVLVCALLKEKR